MMDHHRQHLLDTTAQVLDSDDGTGAVRWVPSEKAQRFIQQRFHNRVRFTVKRVDTN
jgi:hypothetical protein